MKTVASIESIYGDPPTWNDSSALQQLFLRLDNEEASVREMSEWDHSFQYSAELCMTTVLCPVNDYYLFVA